MAARADLWGEIHAPSEVRTPLLVLREQAALLTEKTKGLLRGSVATHAHGNLLVHAFLIVVPALDGYTYQLFEVQHASTELYPVTVPLASPNPGKGKAGTEEQFQKWLGRTLTAPATKKIIANLLAQANS